MKPIKTLALAIGSLFIIPSLAQSKELTAEQIGTAMMRLQATPFHQQTPAGNIWLSLRQNFQLNEVNIALVRSHENRFATNKAYFNRTLNRSKPYMYHITQEVQKRGMPAEIALLPFIESAYVTKARSHAGASGLWQFMPATGRHYGLEQTFMYDGRHDVFAATNAALNYLEYLYSLFGDWSLALAAYNWGEGNVSRAIRQAQARGLTPTYENLRMPNETRNYVPKLLAVRNLINNPQSFGLTLPEIKNEPYFKAVEINAPMDITAAALLANISESEFLALNPGFKTPVFVPKGKNRVMLLPVSAVKTFENNFQAADPKTLLSWNVFTPDSHLDLTQLAKQTGISVNEIKRLNGIRGNKINAGKTILLNRNNLANNTISTHPNFAQLDFDPVPDTFVEQAPVITKQTSPASTHQDPLMTLAYQKTEQQSNIVRASLPTTTPAKPSASNTNHTNSNKTLTHKVRKGDTLYSIAKRYNVTVKEIVSLNNIKGNHITLGQTLKISPRSTTSSNHNRATSKNTNTSAKKQSATPKSYTVRKGDTLAGIAKRYNLKVSDLKQLNNGSSKIRIGQTIKLRR